MLVFKFSNIFAEPLTYFQNHLWTQFFLIFFFFSLKDSVINLLHDQNIISFAKSMSQWRVGWFSVVSFNQFILDIKIDFYLEDISKQWKCYSQKQTPKKLQVSGHKMKVFVVVNISIHVLHFNVAKKTSFTVWLKI